MSARFHELRIATIDPLTDDSVAIGLEIPPDLADTFSALPGQYLTLRTNVDGADIRRSYSICSGPGTPLRVGIRRVDDGRFSTFATRSLRIGDTLQVMPPEGRFIASTGNNETYLLIAAGSGITPMLAIAQATLSASDRSEVTLVYGNRTTGSIMFREALNALKDRYVSRFTLVHTLSREQQDVPLLNGRIDGAKITALCQAGAIDPTGADRVFLCGPAGMIDGVEQALTTLGVPSAQIAKELFLVEGDAPPTPRSARAIAVAEAGVEIDVTLDGRHHSFRLGQADGNVLEAATRAGLDLPFSCTGGMCCTCRCKITRGTAEMAVNYSLEQWEIEAGYTLACQARPTSDGLGLDFDAV